MMIPINEIDIYFAISSPTILVLCKKNISVSWVLGSSTDWPIMICTTCPSFIILWWIDFNGSQLMNLERALHVKGDLILEKGFALMTSTWCRKAYHQYLDYMSEYSSLPNRHGDLIYMNCINDIKLLESISSISWLCVRILFIAK